MKSKIILEEMVDNKERKFGSTDKYYPAHVIDEDGIENPALFTQDQIATAIQRALRNPEDMPEDTIWESIFG